MTTTVPANTSPVAELLKSAENSTDGAWREIVQRYSPLVSSVCRRYRITGADADDVSGNVWLRLVAHLTTIRAPEALPGWLRTTTQRECVTLLRDKQRQGRFDEHTDINETEPGVDAALLVKERHQTVREALAQLRERDQELLLMLFADPPVPYAEISATLDIPIGAIGPTRQRCLARVRRIPAISALLLKQV